MKRRDFSKAAVCVATLGALQLSSSKSGFTSVATAASNANNSCVFPGASAGTNLSGMEWANPGLRYGQSTMPNLNYTVPRTSDVKYLASNGFTKNRLPIQWELLQPMLHDTFANQTAINAIGQPGIFHGAYESYITGVLDAHAEAGIKCIIDCHNYGRYKDFVYQSDGSIRGLVTPSDEFLRPYTSDRTQVRTRIFALAAGATLKQSHFMDFWTRAANKWKNHPGLGGYGIMNEPHNLPKAGEIAEGGTPQDYNISNIFSQAAINAIRAVDSITPIYVGGNEWSNAMGIATQNPGFPLVGSNLIYEVHMYLDAFSNGAVFDYDTEVARGFSAGGSGSINQNTGYNRIKLAIDWAKSKGVKLALTEVGMPIDDPRWESMFKLAVDYAISEGCEIYSWMGGNHWPIHSYPINHVPNWHQNKTMEPTVSGVMKGSIKKAQATLFDDGNCYSTGNPVTITVYARGNLASPMTFNVSSNNGGTFSKNALTIPAGANGFDTFTFTPLPNRVSTLTYSGNSQMSGQVPPQRKIYSITDFASYSNTSLEDAALAIMAKYNSSKWDMKDGYTDYMMGVPSENGQLIRAISDSGFGSSFGNPMEMLNWVNKDQDGQGKMSVPIMRTTNGRKHSDHTLDNTWGFWCKKATPRVGIQANPKNKVLYNIQDAHFAIATVSVPGQNNNGLVFQASQSEELFTSELGFSGGVPSASWIDVNGITTKLVSPNKVSINTPVVIGMTSAPGIQRLRVNAATVANGYNSFAPSVFTQMLIGWGFLSYYPRPGFRGNIYSIITGKGSPSDSEIAIVERYMGKTAGVSI